MQRSKLQGHSAALQQMGDSANKGADDTKTQQPGSRQQVIDVMGVASEKEKEEEEEEK
jgi:hypothetical protein